MLDWKTETAEDWASVVDWVRGLEGAIFLFRGQPQEYGNLKPRLLRLLPAQQDRRLADHLERTLLNDFRRMAHLYLREQPMSSLSLGPTDQNVLQWWGIMQHCGAPTRALDWTGSPYVAVYFAAAKDFQCDGEVLCYEQKKLEHIWNSAMHGERLEGYPTHLNQYKGPGLRLDGTPVLHHLIHGEQIGLMAAQQGVFTVCTDVYRDHGELLGELLGDGENGIGYRRLVIPASQKVYFLKQLRLMNITGASLFPAIEGVGKYVAESATMTLPSSR